MSDEEKLEKFLDELYAVSGRPIKEPITVEKESDGYNYAYDGDGHCIARFDDRAAEAFKKLHLQT